MITFIVHLRVLPVNQPAFSALMAHVVAETRAHEPGVLHYEVSRSVTDKDTFCIVEVYADSQVHAAHMAAAYIRESLPRSAALIEGMPHIRQYVSGDSEPVRQTVETS